jgi:hypothetical protein
MLVLASINAVPVAKLRVALPLLVAPVKLTVATNSLPFRGSKLPLAILIFPLPPSASTDNPKALLVVSTLTKFSLSIGYNKLACTAFTGLLEVLAQICTAMAELRATFLLEGDKDKLGVPAVFLSPWD